MPKQIPKIHEQAAVIEERMAGVKMDNQIEVGSLGRVAPGDRPEDAHVMGAVPLGEGQNRGAMVANCLLRDHGEIIPEGGGRGPKYGCQMRDMRYVLRHEPRWRISIAGLSFLAEMDRQVLKKTRFEGSDYSQFAYALHLVK